MAEDKNTYPAEVGTHEVPTEAPIANEVQSGCPTWDSINNEADYPPFFNPKEDIKREGFSVTFLKSDPRKETPNRFQIGSTDLWFDIQHGNKAYTWTVNQVTLLMELKKHAPLAGKTLQIKLVPVDDAFLKRLPRYRGKDRYMVEEVSPMGGVVIARNGISTSADATQQVQAAAV